MEIRALHASNRDVAHQKQPQNGDNGHLPGWVSQGVWDRCEGASSEGWDSALDESVRYIWQKSEIPFCGCG